MINPWDLCISYTTMMNMSASGQIDFFFQASGLVVAIGDCCTRLSLHVHILGNVANNSLFY